MTPLCRGIDGIRRTKAEWLRTTAGLDASNQLLSNAYRKRALQAATPKGIDVYYENVGGDHLDAARHRMNPRGRTSRLRHDFNLQRRSRTVFELSTT